MLLTVVALALLKAIDADASPAANSITPSVSTDLSCQTKYRDYGPAVELLPTSTQTSCTTLIVTATSTSFTTTTIFPPLITVTNTVTSKCTGGSAASIGTASTASILPASSGSGCTVAITDSTSTPAAASTTTVYTGAYTASKAKRTADPDAEDLPSSSWTAGLIHRPNSSPDSYEESTIAYEVDCLEQDTTFFVTTITTVSTQTITVAQLTTYTTIATCQDVSSYPAIMNVTNATSITPFFPNTTTCFTTTTTPIIFSSTPIPATVTTTQAQACAPSNLLSTVPASATTPATNITSLIPMSSNITQHLYPAADASACCQLCLDTTGCAAMASDGSAGNCFLWFTEPACGVAIRVEGEVGQEVGFVVQAGCGGMVFGGDDMDGGDE